MARIRLGAALLALATAASGLAQAEDAARIETRRRDGLIEVSARARFIAPHAVVWQTLTDYERLPQFLPGMHSSRVLERRGDLVVLEQTGEARFLVFTFAVEVVSMVTERPPQAIEIALLRGNLRRLDGRYELDLDAAGQVRELRWVGVVDADWALPPPLKEMAVRSNIEAQFRGLVREIERRRDTAQKP